MFIREASAHGLFEDVKVETAYNTGYRNKTDRTELFPWNSGVNGLLESSTQDPIDFLVKCFKEFEGNYTIRGAP